MLKKHTGVDLILSNDCQSNAKLMIPCHPNEIKFKLNLLFGVQDRHNEENNYDALNRKKDNSVEICKLKYNELVLN